MLPQQPSSSHLDWHAGVRRPCVLDVAAEGFVGGGQVGPHVRAIREQQPVEARHQLAADAAIVPDEPASHAKHRTGINAKK